VSYLSSISRLSQQGNLGGLVTLQVARKADIISIAAPVNGVVYGEITFVEDAGFVTWQVSTESAGTKSQGNSTREGFTVGNSLPFRIPKQRADITAMLDQATEDELIVLFKDANGKQMLFGLLDSPVRFEYDRNTGISHADLNHYAGRFFYQGPGNMFEYQGSIEEAPAGPAPAVVKLNGTPIASLAPGEVLELNSDYTIDYFTITGP
jgi:hypothetical protein